MELATNYVQFDFMSYCIYSELAICMLWYLGHKKSLKYLCYHILQRWIPMYSTIEKICWLDLSFDVLHDITTKLFLILTHQPYCTLVSSLILHFLQSWRAGSAGTTKQMLTKHCFSNTHRVTLDNELQFSELFFSLLMWVMGRQWITHSTEHTNLVSCFSSHIKLVNNTGRNFIYTYICIWIMHFSGCSFDVALPSWKWLT